MADHGYESGRLNLPFVGHATFGKAPPCTDWEAIDADVAVLGVPYDMGTQYRSGARFGPRGIREASTLFSFGHAGVYDHEDDIVVGLQEGADDYVTKPFSKNELQARLTVGTRVVGMWNRLIEAERNRVLMQTAGAAAHEINNPLAVMSGQIQLLLTKPLDDDIKEKLQGIRDAGTRVSEIVNKMKSISEYVTKPYTKGTDIIDFGSEADK